MNIIVNGVILPEPATALTEWITVAGQKLRQLTISYDFASATDAKIVLENAIKDPPLNLTYITPHTNNNQTFPVQCHAAAAHVLREHNGALQYAPLLVTLREVVE